eukprot:SAG11_NODE_8262_length_1038_cov_0.933972_2_plen_166_part_00
MAQIAQCDIDCLGVDALSRPLHLDLLHSDFSLLGWCTAAMMGHGMLGVVGAGALNGIEQALWDIKGKALGCPVWQLLGGKMRDRVHVYAHAASVESAQALVEKGYDSIKIGGGQNCLQVGGRAITSVVAAATAPLFFAALISGTHCCSSHRMWRRSVQPLETRWI